MTRQTKRTINSIILFLSSFIYFYLAFIGYKNRHIDLTKYSRIDSEIEGTGTDYHYGSKGNKSFCFFVKLKDLDKKLGVYRMRQAYDDLLQNLSTGDSITVYFKNNNNKSENINIDLLEIVKSGKIVLDKSEYEKKESSLIYIGVIAGVLTVFMTYLYYTEKIMKNRP